FGQRRQVLEELPHLAPGSAAIGRRVEQDDIVAVAAALLALRKLHRVLHDPADRPVGKPRDLLVLAGPADCLFRGVDMGDLRARAGCDEGGKPRIAEQIEHLHRPARSPDQRLHMRPVRGLLGKDADMPERGETAEIVDAVVAHRPGFAESRLWKAPTAEPLLVRVAGEDCVGRRPFAFGKRRLPYRLAFGAHDAIRPVLLQLPPSAGIEQRVVTTRRDLEDDGHPLVRQRACPALKLAPGPGDGRSVRLRSARFGTAGFRLLPGAVFTASVALLPQWFLRLAEE